MKATCTAATRKDILDRPGYAVKCTGCGRTFFGPLDALVESDFRNHIS